MWGMKTTNIPVVIRALGLINKGLEKYTDKIPGNINIHEVQKMNNNNNTLLIDNMRNVCMPEGTKRVDKTVYNALLQINTDKKTCLYKWTVERLCLFMRLNFLTVGIALYILPGIIPPWYISSQSKNFNAFGPWSLSVTLISCKSE